MSVCEEIASSVGALFHCTPHDKKMTRIRTPFVYPDGDVVDLFCSTANGVSTLTDLGESMRWLRMQTTTPRRSERQREMIQDMCLTHRVQLFKGQLTLRLGPTENLAEGVLRLSQAAVQVGDIWLMLRTRSAQTLTDEVADFFSERGIPHERNAKFSGRSGRGIVIDFHTRTPTRTALIQVLTTGNRANGRSAADRALSIWYDLQHLKVSQTGLHLVSLFDDTTNVWTEDQFRLLGEISDVAYWSRPDEVEQLLTAA